MARIKAFRVVLVRWPSHAEIIRIVSISRRVIYVNVTAGADANVIRLSVDVRDLPPSLR